MQEFTDALVKCLRFHGGEPRTDAAVEEILIRDGSATAVRLANGETIHAKHVIGALDGAMRGVMPAETPMWAMMPSAGDRAQVPPGSAGDTMYCSQPRFRTPSPTAATGPSIARHSPLRR